MDSICQFKFESVTLILPSSQARLGAYDTGFLLRIPQWCPAIPHANSNPKAEYPDYQVDEPDREYMMRDSSQLGIDIG